MLALHELQRAFANGIVSGQTDAIAFHIHGGAIAPEERLRIHRNTMLGALAGALRLSYPAVDALVGTDFFDQATAKFARVHPPRAALLTLYGDDFPAFLADYAPAAGLPYLADVARLEWAVDHAARASAHDEAPPSATFALPGVTVAFAPSLRLLHCDYPAHSIWRAVLDDDGTALARIDPNPAPGRLAIWRDGDGAGVAPIGLIAAAFLDRMLAGADAETALAAAAASDPVGDPIAGVSTEILSAGFTRLTATS